MLHEIQPQDWVFGNAKPGIPVMVKVADVKMPGAVPLRKGERRNEWAKSDWHRGEVDSSKTDSMKLKGTAEDQFLNGKMLIRNPDGSWKCEGGDIAYVIKLYDPDNFQRVRVVDCQMADWGDWDACSCGAYTRGRKRWFLRTPRFGGKPCAEETTHEIEQCKCEGEDFEPIWCRPKDWEDWGQCSTTCGVNGQRKRLRFFTVYKGDPIDLIGEGHPQDHGLGQSLAYTHDLRAEYEKLDTELRQTADRQMRELILAFSTGMVAFVVLMGGVKLWGRFMRNPRHDGYDAIAGSDDDVATPAIAVAVVE
jgi:hypothetical protein